MIEIVAIAPEHIESFHRTLDLVAKERRFLSFLEAPPIESTRAFVGEIIRQGHPQFVVLSRGDVVGWCDVLPKSRPIYSHTGVLGVGLLPAFRGQGIGSRLILQTLDAAYTFGLSRVELTVRENNKNAIALYWKIGFETEGLLRNSVKIDGVHENVIMMAQLL
jgi:ribosomal protein S18 acetylase RimI-like enzyme